MKMSLKNIYLVCFSLLCLFVFSVAVKAGSATCTYEYITIEVDENMEIKYSKNSSDGRVDGEVEFFGNVKDFYNNDKFSCPENIYRTKYNKKGTVYRYSFAKEGGYNNYMTVKLSSSDIDNSSSSSSSKISRVCTYDNYTVNYYSNGTSKAFRGNSQLSDFELEGTDISNYCPRKLYVLGNKARFYKFSDYANSYSISANDKGTSSNDSSSSNSSTINSSFNCSTLGDVGVKGSPAYWLNWGLNLMKYIAIIALLLLVVMDFLQAMVQNDKDALKKTGIKAIKRFIYCVILFFVPDIINILLNLFGITGTCDYYEGGIILWQQLIIGQ